jgi:hypothetical protein
MITRATAGRSKVLLIVSILLVECISVSFCYPGTSEDDEDMIRQQQIKKEVRHQQNQGVTPVTQKSKGNAAKVEETNKELLYDYLHRKKTEEKASQDLTNQETLADQQQRDHLHDSRQSLKMDLYERAKTLLEHSNYSPAIPLLEQASESLNPLAAFELGRMYLVSVFNHLFH